MQKYLALLRERRQFRLLWIAQVISLTGDWFNTIATVIIVNNYTDSSTYAISGLFLARSLPVFLASPIAGVIADRFDRKWILIISNWARVFVVLGFLLVRDESLVWLVYTLTIAQFTLSAFFEPAYAAILPRLVSKDDLLTANTLGSVTWSVMLTLGAAIGGVVAGLFGVQIALLIDAITFAVAGSVIFLIGYEFSPNDGIDEIDPEAIAQEKVNGFIEGVRYLRQYPNIALVALVKGLAQVGTIDVAVAVYADQVFRYGRDGATTLGVLFAAHGLGAILGPLLGDSISDGSERALKTWITLGFAMMVVGWFIFGVGGTLFVVTIGMVIRGMGGSINWTYSSVILQMTVPDRYLGRVFGIDFAFFTLTLSLATIFMGFLIDTLHVAPRESIIYIAIGSIIPLLFWMGAIRIQDQRRQTRALDAQS